MFTNTSTIIFYEQIHLFSNEILHFSLIFSLNTQNLPKEIGRKLALAKMNFYLPKSINFLT